MFFFFRDELARKGKIESASARYEKAEPFGAARNSDRRGVIDH